jgi:N-acetylglucosaminyldiphosphoundecaprenol N-acetyl-beta-D-mannosaminyltransferase
LWKKKLMHLPTREASWSESPRRSGALETLAASSTPLATVEVDEEGLPAVELDGVLLNALTEKQSIEFILDELDAGRGGVAITPNVDHIRRCKRDLQFAAIMAESDLVVPDGMPLVWASRLAGTPLPQRVAGSDLISSLSAAAAARGKSIYLLGGTQGTADSAARILQGRNPFLRIAGTACPPLGFDQDTAQIEAIAGKLKLARPDIVFVALGSPKQERLIDQIRPALPHAWWLGVGVSFSFLSGDVRRAPVWMQRNGLEWLHRLSQEPRRLFRRYVIVGLPYAGWMLLTSATTGLSRRLTSRNPNADATPRVRRRPMRSVDVESIEPADQTEAQSKANAGLAVDAIRAELMTISDRAGVSGRAATSLARLRALVLLGGSVRPKPLNVATERNVLDLPLGAKGTILGHWMNGAAELSRRLELDGLPVRLLLDRDSVAPARTADGDGLFQVEWDASDYRGSAGVLSRFADQYEDDDLILVADAGQVLTESLTSLATALKVRGGIVSLLAHGDDTPGGVMLVTCKALRLIPRVGFVDMKEQGLPAIARQYDVRVVTYPRATGLPVRGLSDYVQALRELHRRGPDDQSVGDPLEEDWKPTFALSEAGASVDPTARIHDSIVLAGGVVEAGAVVVRSLVCAGAVVAKVQRVVDQLVTRGKRP